MLKIGFCGTHGTGKTTLARELAIKLNSQLITGLMRGFWKDYGVCDFEKLPKRVRYVFQEISLDSQIESEKQAISFGNKLGLSGFVTDRTVIDQLAYTINDTDASPKEIESYSQKCQNHCNSYTHIFYLPIEFEFQSEELRAAKDSQEAIDKLINEYSSKFCKNKIWKLEGSVEERINTALNRIFGIMD